MSAPAEEATITYRGITATVRIEDYPDDDRYVRLILTADPLPRGLDQEVYIGHIRAVGTL